MAAQPDGGTPVETGSDGGDQEVDLRALAARVRKCEEHNRECAEFRGSVVATLDRQLQYLAKELRALLS